MRKFIGVIIIAVIITFTGCYYDKEVVPPEGGLATCDTIQMSYSSDIVNILNSNGCSGCHSAPSGSGGVIVTTHSGLTRVANDGRLMQAITWSGPVSTHMPQGGNKMSACEIAKISAWIKEGARNN